MPCHNHNTMPGDPVVRVLRVFGLLLALCAAPAAFAVDSGEIVVVSAKGEVHVTMKGAQRAVRAGTALDLPATVRTGRDGAIELRQGATTVSVGPETLLEFPALEKPGAPIDRIQQPHGNAFYDIGKREGRKLRIETPYLVGVVKGTQFNVAAQEQGATISLFEGLLEVRATDDSAVVELKAGEIASRRRGDQSINVIKMEAGKAPPAGPRQQGGGPDSNAVGSPVSGSIQEDDSRGVVRPVISTVVDIVNGASAPAVVGAEVRTPVGGVDADVAVSAGSGNADMAASAAVSVVNTVDTGTSIAVDLDRGGAAVDVAQSTSVDAGPVAVSVDTSTSVDVGAAGVAVDVTHGTGVDVGPISAAVDTGASVDLGPVGAAVDVVTSVAVDAGPVSVDVDTGAALAVDTGGVGADLTTGAAIDAGPIAAGLDTGTSLDVGTGGASVAVDTAAALDVLGTPVEIPVAVNTGVDLGTGSVDLGVAVAGVDLGLGIDLGLGDDTGQTDSSNPAPAPAIIDVGGLLDGLLRRPGRK